MEGSGAAGQREWKLSNDGKNVRQTVNDAPTFFVAPGDVINTTVRGRLRVEDRSDDDFIGFVFGYQAPLGEAAKGKGKVRCDFFLFDWKAADQEVRPRGLRADAGAGRDADRG